MSRSGRYIGGGSIIHISGGFTGWSNSIRSPAKVDVYPQPKRAARRFNKLSDIEKDFLYALAHSSVWKGLQPPIPRSLGNYVKSSSDLTRWINSDRRRKSCFSSYVSAELDRRNGTRFASASPKKSKRNSRASALSQADTVPASKAISPKRRELIRDIAYAVELQKGMSEIPRNLASDIQQHDGLLQWIGAQPELTALFNDFRAEARAKRAGPRLEFLHLCIRAAREGKLTPSFPVPGWDVGAEILKAGGNFGWIKSDASRKAKFETTSGTAIESLEAQQLGSDQSVADG